MSFWGRIRTFLGRKAPPRPGPRPSRASGITPALKHLDAPGTDPSRPSMKWHVERAGPRYRGGGWIKRVTRRQKVLAALGSVAFVAMVVTFGLRLMAEKRLPQSVQGLWRTSVAEYSGRMVELRARRVAFLTGDTARPVSSFIIERVRRDEEDDAGIVYHVEFSDEDGPQEFSFIFDQGPPDRIRFANQPRLVWHRDPSNRSLLPGF